MHSTLLAALVAVSSTGVSAAPAAWFWDFILPDNFTSNLNFYGAPANDFGCQSDKNPVVMLHGLSANHEVDLNVLQQDMNALGWCTYGQTYGAHTLVPWVGGLKAMRDSAKDVADFIREVHAKTGKKVDLVGHSEGGVMAIYAPMTQPGIADIVEHAVALGPAVHGAKYFGFTDLWYFGGDATREFVADVLKVAGCPACDDLATDGDVYADFKANLGHIAQPGVKTTVLMSRSDTLVAPETSIVDEAGVRNIYVQDFCADDKVGHAGLAWDRSVAFLSLQSLLCSDPVCDRNVWTIIKNELEEKYDATIDQCETAHIITI